MKRSKKNKKQKSYFENNTARPTAEINQEVTENNDKLIEELKSMFDKGLISSAEFNKAINYLIICTARHIKWEDYKEASEFIWTLRGSSDYYYNFKCTHPLEQLKRIKKLNNLKVDASQDPRYAIKKYADRAQSDIKNDTNYETKKVKIIDNQN